GVIHRSRKRAAGAHGGGAGRAARALPGRGARRRPAHRVRRGGPGARRGGAPAAGVPGRLPARPPRGGTAVGGEQHQRVGL
ncbi:MAG: hypothetical protein AVDCRST_MAG89-4163, partial [uncultured Gemmatimonadetes bacterium]